MEPPGPMGLIPSQELEERRKAFVPPEADYVHKIGICGTRVSGIVWEQLLNGVLAKFINSVLRQRAIEVNAQILHIRFVRFEFCIT